MSDYYWENHKGMKIESRSFFVHGAESIPYSIHLCKDDCFFFIKSKNPDLISIIKEHSTFDYWPDESKTLADCRKEIRRIEKIFEAAQVEQIKIEYDVLVYNLKMNLCCNEKDEIKNELYDVKDNALSFGFIKCKRVDVNDCFVEYYYINENGKKCHVGSHEWDSEIPWTPKAEILFENIDQGLLKLLLKLDEFFGDGSLDLMLSIKQGKLLGFLEDKK